MPQRAAADAVVDAVVVAALHEQAAPLDALMRWPCCTSGLHCGYRGGCHGGRAA